MKLMMSVVLLRPRPHNQQRELATMGNGLVLPKEHLKKKKGREAAHNKSFIEPTLPFAPPFRKSGFIDSGKTAGKDDSSIFSVPSYDLSSGSFKTSRAQAKQDHSARKQLGASNNSAANSMRELRKQYTFRNIYQQPLPHRESGFRPPVFERTNDEMKLIRGAMKRNFVFNDLTERELDPLVKAFVPCSFGPDSIIIKQGDPGDFFYIIESGEVIFQVQGVEVGRAAEGTSFGELSLLYTVSVNHCHLLGMSHLSLFCYSAHDVRR
jgi:hypothetical protein